MRILWIRLYLNDLSSYMTRKWWEKWIHFLLWIKMSSICCRSSFIVPSFWDTVALIIEDEIGWSYFCKSAFPNKLKKQPVTILWGVFGSSLKHLCQVLQNRLFSQNWELHFHQVLQNPLFIRNWELNLHSFTKSSV